MHPRQRIGESRFRVKAKTSMAIDLTSVSFEDWLDFVFDQIPFDAEGEARNVLSRKIQ